MQSIESLELCPLVHELCTLIVICNYTYMHVYVHDSSLMEAFTFIHVCIDSSHTVLEHHRPFVPFISTLPLTCIGEL